MAEARTSRRPRGSLRVDRRVLIMIALADGDLHGYAVMLSIEEFAALKLQPSTLYGALRRLVTEGLVEPIGAAKVRQPYRLTLTGRSALNAQLTEQTRLARIGLDRLSQARGD